MAKDNSTSQDEAGATDAPAVQSTTVRGRVLLDCGYGKCDDVIEIDAELAATLTGVIDTDPAAVAYADSIKKA